MPVKVNLPLAVCGFNALALAAVSVPVPALSVRLRLPEPPNRAFCKMMGVPAPTPTAVGRARDRFKAVVLWLPLALARLMAMLALLLPSLPNRRTPRLLAKVLRALAWSETVPADNKALSAAAVPLRRVATSNVPPAVKLSPLPRTTPLPLRLGRFSADCGAASSKLSTSLAWLAATMALAAHFRGSTAPGMATMLVGRVKRPLFWVALLTAGVAKVTAIWLKRWPVASAKRSVSVPAVPL